MIATGPAADNRERPYVKRGLGNTSQKKYRFYHNARRRALTKLKERHAEEFETLFAEQLERFTR